MHDFLNLFYPVVNATTDENAEEIARLEQIKGGDPFFVVPGWNEETTKTSLAQVTFVQRIRLENEAVDRILAKAKFLKEFPYSKAPPLEEGEVGPAYQEDVIDASVHAGYPSHIAITLFAEALWWKVVDIANELLNKSKLREATYKKKPVTPIRIMVLTNPRLAQYLKHYQGVNGGMSVVANIMVSQCLNTRIGSKIFIAVARVQEDRSIAEPFTFGTLKYANPTKLNPPDALKGYMGYQMHYEFVDNIPVLGVLEAEELDNLLKPKLHTGTNVFI